ncbi:unnamed protein product, partial [Larinioides sclopetarius]
KDVTSWHSVIQRDDMRSYIDLMTEKKFSTKKSKWDKTQEWKEIRAVVSRTAEVFPENVLIYK